MRRVLAISTAIACIAGHALAQAPSPGPAASVWITDVQGVLKAFALTPVGDVEGSILTDGNGIHVPPHLTAQVMSAVHSGDRVAVRGRRVGVPNLFMATSLTGQNGQSVVDNRPSPPGSSPSPPADITANARNEVVEGRVAQLLHGPAGDVNGALLEDGTTLKLPPRIVWQKSAQIQVGRNVKVSGWLLATSHGRVVEIQSIGDMRVSQAPSPPPPGAAPPPPPPPGAAPPPPPPPGAAPPPPPPPGAADAPPPPR